MDKELRFANPFAGSLQKAARPKRRFENKNGVATPGFVLEKFPRRFAAYFFVGRPKKNNALEKGNT